MAILPAAFVAGPAPILAANDRYGDVTVGGIRTARIGRGGLAGLMLADCLEARTADANPKLVFASNGHAIALAAQDGNFRDTLSQADIIHADGQAVVFASRLTKSPIPERSATTDFIHDAAALAARSAMTRSEEHTSELQSL